MFPIMAGNSASTGYNLTRSLRFRASASVNMGRTPAVSGNQHTWTWSGWVKRAKLASVDTIFSSATAIPSSNLFSQFYFTSSDKLSFFQFHSSVAYTTVITTQVFRDPSAWYHIVFVYDDTQATAANRVKFYVNGILVTAFDTANYPSQNFNGFWNAAQPAKIGQDISNSSNQFDGYLAETYFIDGQALTPSSFGSINALTGVWQPARYTGTYGTNGFYLPFTDNSALTTSSNVGLGKDFSGNGNYWTTNNISITAGVTYDSMTDVPTLTSATAANFAVLNPLISGNTLTNGNLNSAGGAAASTIAVNSGKWYVEFATTGGSSTGGYPILGVWRSTVPTGSYPGSINGYGIGGYTPTNVLNQYLEGAGAGTVSGQTAWASTDIAMFALDIATGKIWAGRNGTWFGSGNPATGANPIQTLTANDTYYFGTQTAGLIVSVNFGQRPFSFSPPSGYVALNAYNLP